MKVMVLSDHQIPFHDTKAIAAVHKYMADFQPDTIIINGDLLDFADLTTKYLRDARNRGQTKKHIEIARDMLKEELSLAPKAKIIVLEGNHEDRVRVLVQEQADGLEPFLADELSLARMLALPRVEFRGGYTNGSAYWEHGGLVVTHGSFTGPSAGKNMLAQEGSVIFGHTNHETLHSHTNRDGTHKAWGFGCLCNVTGDNMPPRSGHAGVPNWQQGFGIVLYGRRCYSVYPIGLTNGGFVSPEGKEYVG